MLGILFYMLKIKNLIIVLMFQVPANFPGIMRFKIFMAVISTWNNYEKCFLVYKLD